MTQLTRKELGCGDQPGVRVGPARLAGYFVGAAYHLERIARLLSSQAVGRYSPTGPLLRPNDLAQAPRPWKSLYRRSAGTPNSPPTHQRAATVH